MDRDIRTTLHQGTSRASARGYQRVWKWMVLVGLIQAGYAAVFIARSSFVVEGQRYFCLFDDAMISMRYAANWADGQGLVWNPGERVEGYTNFAWTGLMGLCHLLRLSPSHACLLVQLLGIPVLWSCLVATVLLARACRLLPVSAGCAVLFAGLCYNLFFWTLLGMETGLLTCLVTLALAESAKALQRKQGSAASMLWFAPALLTRPDIVPVLAFVFVFLMLSVPRGRFRVMFGAGLAALPELVHVLWRHGYYGEWFPNTYYLKATGWPLVERLGPGFEHTLWTLGTFGFPLLLAGMALIRPKRRHILLLGSFAVSVAYQMYIGGDIFPLNRFVLPTSLALFVLAGEGIHRLMHLFMQHKTRLRGAILRAAFGLLGIVALNARWWDEALMLGEPHGLAFNRSNVRYVHALNRIANPDASVAVGAAGGFPYFSQRRRCFDQFGKCDPYIARLRADPRFPIAGHNKRDLVYTVSTYKPDVVLHAVDVVHPEFYKCYRPIAVEVDGVKLVFCIRKDSRKVRGGMPVDWQTLNEHLVLIGRARPEL